MKQFHSGKVINRAGNAAWLFLLTLSTSLLAQSGSPKTTDIMASRADLCVTEGAIEQLPDHRLSVNVPKMRAYLNLDTPQYLEARFTYLGPTGNESRLGSGELRRQFGIKLHAEDACNLVYAMWRIEPESKLVVSVKSNPGQHSSAECANRGYKNIKPAFSTGVPALTPGQAHTLRAEMTGQQLRVFIDNALAWKGSVGQEALSFHGPVGIRSDNARLDIELHAKRPDGPIGAPPACRSGPQESD